MGIALSKSLEHLNTLSSNSSPLFFILGPCAMESREHTLFLAQEIARLRDEKKCHIIFKASFDKANRTSAKGYRSLGMEKGLEILAEVRSTYELPVVTDVHETWQVPYVSQVADIVQIPAFLCRQTDLIAKAAKTGKVVFIKKGQFLAAENVAQLIEKATQFGGAGVWIGERGYTFGYKDLIVDFRGFPVMKSFGKPVVFDVTHSVQQPGGAGCSSGGNRSFVAPLVVSAVAQGIAGVFMEIHENPDLALSDGPNSVRLSDLSSLVTYLIQLDAWTKERSLPHTC